MLGLIDFILGGLMLLGALLDALPPFHPTPAQAAENWVLWAQVSRARDLPFGPELRPIRSVGVYPTAPACLAAARAYVTRWVDETGRTETFATVPEDATASDRQESANPPGVHVDLTVTSRAKPGYEDVVIARRQTYSLDTACWPAGVTPR